MSVSALLRKLIEQSVRNKETLPDPEPVSDPVPLHISITGYEQTAMLYRADTLAGYVRALLQQRMSPEVSRK